ncbi:MAG: U32 family peptidase [Muribaculaceae bacterium]|nr:U32 family peptidase [Muribaculaceae bacterium]
MKVRTLELLSPAANAEIAIDAILHGADAVYIGPPSHGARKSASNSIEDIERVVDFAHRYRAKVYATVNTIIYDNEIREVETLCRDLYHAGVDALIVQDMGILRMKIPPIALHASTQCDIRTPEKARFLQEVGFSQLVLARELTLEEIKRITSEVTIPVETFVHGALCVCYSGRCHASYAVTKRSANRGECAQICRLPFDLRDADGNLICKNKHLLSLKDFNASHNLEALIDAGVSSFKIEGRLKDLAYVKNITSLYNLRLNSIISKNPQQFKRSSFGEVRKNFEPQADKSFNRGFTPYFLEDRKPRKITSMDTPKSLGEEIKSVSQLNNGDGISFFDRDGNFQGVNINGIVGNKIIPARKIDIPSNSKLFRTFDVKWEKLMAAERGERKIGLAIELENNRISAKDEREVEVILPLDLPFEESRKKMDYKDVFERLGNTSYFLTGFSNNIDSTRFYRISELTALRRKLINLLDKTNKATYPFEYRKRENHEVLYFSKELDYRDNVANKLAMKFYKDHGVEKIEPALETTREVGKGKRVMTTRHCILRELGMCKKEKGNSRNLRFPLYLDYSGGRFLLEFDCKKCEMGVCAC